MRMLSAGYFLTCQDCKNMNLRPVRLNHFTINEPTRKSAALKEIRLNILGTSTSGDSDQLCFVRISDSIATSAVYHCSEWT